MKGEYKKLGGTVSYFDPLRLKCWKKNKQIPLDQAIKSDAFSFGLSILEMGNLLSYKNIKVNKEEKLLNE